ncbi:Fe-S cluster assembly protein HesB [Microtetraspora sp. NBRC 16547]|uniref:HesB/IscA family protein n=1 Tax=Microtetraspora sp. NBRC 16547 TaxID=3030993 RepID=UPI0025533D0A|nr:Fe-S cluster assembly protein HesB [Microtetraspora sp. NBRC 16547]
MLTMTDKAVRAIRDLMVGEYLPHRAGLRIAVKPGEAGALEFSLASDAWSGDQVIEKEDVRVFIDPDAVTLLDDKTLDAESDAHGRPVFRLTPSC